MSTNRAKASKTLQFCSANTSSTTCASSICSQPLLACANPLSYVRGALSPILQRVGPNYRVFPRVETTQDFRPPLTSTPSRLSVSLKENQQVRISTSTFNKVSVQYPSKILNKTLHGTYELRITKALSSEILNFDDARWKASSSTAILICEIFPVMAVTMQS